MKREDVVEEIRKLHKLNDKTAPTFDVIETAASTWGELTMVGYPTPDSVDVEAAGHVRISWPTHTVTIASDRPRGATWVFQS